MCAGFSWGRVDFLHSSWYGAMLCVSAGNSAGNTGMAPIPLGAGGASGRVVLSCQLGHDGSKIQIFYIYLSSY